MINIDFKILFLKKKFPLKISRGTFSGSDNLFVFLSNGNEVGIGEMCPGSTEGASTVEIGKNQIERFIQETGTISESIVHNYDKGCEFGLAPCALAALDAALWDLRAKEAKMSLHKLLGLGLPNVATSITIGIMPPKEIEERVKYLSAFGLLNNLKIKLGSPQGIEYDKEIFSKCYELLKDRNVSFRVDANGGWNERDAKDMLYWLQGRNVEYIEQPLEKGNEEGLKFLFKNRSLPIFVDESCRNSYDIPKLSDSVDGINLKLMKCGGLTEALRMVAVSRAYNLKTMIGCMGESSISIGAGVAISALFDHIDLDSHLNLAPDPGVGLSLVEGRVIPPNLPGHGVGLKNAAD